MVMLRPPMLLMSSLPEPLDVHVQIPSPDDNLFERLIRDPQAPDRPMRERQCAEMLRAVLVACPSLRSHVFQWLARLTETPAHIIDELDWQMETEQAIGSKRDDLRIEGFQIDENGESDQVVLWTVEIKVAAPLHESSRQDLDAQSNETLEHEPEIVNQLLNYDTWLADQEVGHKAGFVLALQDKSTDLPKGLSQRWQCVTWTKLSMEVEMALANDNLPNSERPFARHMLGFIRHRLWDETDMANTQLELDDVALLRAHATIGQSCSRKVKDLVGQFKELIESTNVSFHNIKTTTSVFDRVDIPQYFVWAECTSDNRTWLNVNAGIVADDVRVWISCNPNAKEVKKAVRTRLHECRTGLTDRNPSWVVIDVDDPGYTDAEIRKPLVSVLGEEDWRTPLINFVRESLNDLKVLGILDGLVAIDSKKVN